PLATETHASFLLRLYRRQSNKKLRPLPRHAFDTHFAAVGLDDVFHDGQAEAGAALLPRARLVDAVETFEYPGKRFSRNAGAVIAHGELHPRVVETPAGERDLAIRAPIL